MTDSQARRRSELSTGWTVRPVAGLEHVPEAVRAAGAIPATVPGCVHTDLLAAGLIPDPYLDRNQDLVQWIGRVSWRYACTFDVSAAVVEGHDRHDLACDGLDTVGVVTLNGVEVGRCEDMHLRYRFDVRGVLRAGANELAIDFTAPLAYVAEQAQVWDAATLPVASLGSNPQVAHHMIRKMACNFGWDWGPPLATCGVWRPAAVESWSAARLAAVRPIVREATAERAVLEVACDVERGGAAALQVRGTLTGPDGAVFDAEARAGEPLRFVVPHPQRWWPVGYGAQPRYRLDVTLVDGTGVTLDAQRCRVGLRTTELVTTPDADGKGATFHLAINGQRVFCKGGNWIPDDCFPHRVTRQRYTARVRAAVDANMNMLRVWGGGLYERDDFYDACDEQGVLVWQDFLFACAAYPEESPYRELVEREVADNLARLACHPALVLWCGCNENIWATWDWGPQWGKLREPGARTWGLGYYLGLLPKLVAELQPDRPYWPGSPWSGSVDVQPNSGEFGDVHIWNVWHGSGQYRNYLNWRPRFASEFGYHGPPTWPTLARAIPADQRRWDAPTMKLHNKNGRDGQVQTRERMADDFVPPDAPQDFDNWCYLAQVMQARALAMGCEWFRALSPWCSGAVYWQFNDCWPVSSWSCLDGDGGKKPLWHASRRFFAPRLCTIKPTRPRVGDEPVGELSVYLHNDAAEPWRGECVLRRMHVDGRVLGEVRVAVDVAARGVQRFEVPGAMADPRRDAAGFGQTFLVAGVGDEVEGRGYWWFAADKEIAYPTPVVEVTTTATAEGWAVVVAAGTLVRDLCVFAERVDPRAEVLGQGVTLLAGDRAVLPVRGCGLVEADRLAARPVLQCANWYGKAGGA